MTVQIIADLHLWHQTLERKGIRPVGFTDVILRNCQKLLAETDTVICLGDVGFNDKALAAWMASAPGRWTNIRGNHDHKASFYEKNGFVFCCESLVRKHNGLTILFSHEPFIPLPDYVDYNIHGHLHLNPEHRAFGYESNEFYQQNRDRYILIEIESNLAPRTLDSILLRKRPLAPCPREIENEQGPADA